MRTLTETEVKAVAGGRITKVNGGGNTPNGNANGIPATNPAGKAPLAVSPPLSNSAGGAFA